MSKPYSLSYLAGPASPPPIPQPPHSPVPTPIPPGMPLPDEYPPDIVLFDICL